MHCATNICIWAGFVFSQRNLFAFILSTSQVRDIKIPSILIAKSDGDAFKNEILSGGEPVLVEVEWKMPSQWPVAVNFWADPGDTQGTCKSFAFARARLVLSVIFQLMNTLPTSTGAPSTLILNLHVVSCFEVTFFFRQKTTPLIRLNLVLSCSCRVSPGVGSVYVAPRGSRAFPDNIQCFFFGWRL